jgi:hypothetical protein
VISGDDFLRKGGFKVHYIDRFNVGEIGKIVG